MSVLRPLKAIRAYCLDCATTAKAVAYCPNDGVHSNLCPLWHYRFGKRPETTEFELGEAMVNPKLMPGSGVELDSLPANPRHYVPPQPR